MLIQSSFTNKGKDGYNDLNLFLLFENSVESPLRGGPIICEQEAVRKLVVVGGDYIEKRVKCMLEAFYSWEHLRKCVRPGAIL